MTEYAATSIRWPRTQATWSARHGLAWKPGPLVSPMTTYSASSRGIGCPKEILCGIPIPGGHWGHEMSPPSTGPSRGATDASLWALSLAAASWAAIASLASCLAFPSASGSPATLGASLVASLVASLGASVEVVVAAAVGGGAASCVDA